MDKNGQKSSANQFLNLDVARRICGAHCHIHVCGFPFRDYEGNSFWVQCGFLDTGYGGHMVSFAHISDQSIWAYDAVGFHGGGLRR
jgi:hypothetical protein